MKKILIFTDSLGLPRAYPEVTLFEETWPELFRRNYPQLELHKVCLGGATTKEILGQIDYHKLFNPDLVIVQVGIVDCAPRFLTRKELLFMRLLPFSKYILKSLNNKNVKRIRGVTYTSKKQFKSNIEKINKSFDCKVVFIGILPASFHYENQLPGVIKNITDYNHLLSQYEFLDTNGFPQEGIMSDYHHLNPLGNQILFESLKTKLNILYPQLNYNSE